MIEQNYEDYWSLTNAFTDYNGEGFLETLKISVKLLMSLRKKIIVRKNILVYKRKFKKNWGLN